MVFIGFFSKIQNDCDNFKSPPNPPVKIGPKERMKETNRSSPQGTHILQRQENRI